MGADSGGVFDAYMQSQDPMRQIGLETAQLQLEQMRQPDPGFTVLSAQEAAALGLDPASVWQRGPNGELAVLQPAGGADGGTSYGLTPQYGVDAQGNPVLLQVGNDGTAVQTQMPEGVTLSREPIRVDAGTEWVLLDPITRQPIGTIPKNNQEAAIETQRGQVLGQAQGEAIAGASSAVAQADQVLAQIEAIRDDPELPRVTGMIQGRLPAFSQAGTDLNVKIEQLRGQAFLQAFDMLRGAGSITVQEGQAATAAMARLDQAQSTEAYQAALQELYDILKVGRDRAARNLPAPAEQTTPEQPRTLTYNSATGQLE
jgi:hypothetical protein